jgi:hypothetical protein
MKQFFSPMLKQTIMVLAAFLPFASNAQFSLTGTTYTQNFDGIGALATAAVPTGFKYSGTGGTLDYTAASNVTNTVLAFGTTGAGVVTGTSSGGPINWANGITATSTERALVFCQLVLTQVLEISYLVLLTVQVQPLLV